MLYIPAGGENCHSPGGQSTCVCKNYALLRPKCRLSPSDCYKMLLQRYVNVLKRVSFGSKDCTKELKLECAYFPGQTS